MINRVEEDDTVVAVGRRRNVFRNDEGVYPDGQLGEVLLRVFV